MNAVVIEHVRVSELPEDWRLKLQAPTDACVTVRIEEENATSIENSNNPLFGMWADRADMADVGAYVRELRASRFNQHKTGMMPDVD